MQMKLIVFGQEQALPVYEGAGHFLRGAALLERGQVEVGLAEMQQGMPGVRAARAGLVSGGIGWFAMAHVQAGQAEKGCQLLEEALATTREYSQRSVERLFCYHSRETCSYLTLDKIARIELKQRPIFGRLLSELAVSMPNRLSW